MELDAVPGRKQVIGLLRQAKVELALASGSARSAALWGSRNRATTDGAVSTAVTPDTLVKSGVLAPAHRYTGHWCALAFDPDEGFDDGIQKGVCSSMHTASLTALSALAGSVIGGLTTGITTWLSLRSQARVGHRSGQLVRRQDLFSEFITAASKAYGEALFSTEPKIQDLIALYALVSQMRVLCSAEIVASAQRIIVATIDTYYTPNRTVREVNDMTKTGTLIDPLREFSESAREELRGFRPF
jgi:hypothetical protein